MKLKSILNCCFTLFLLTILLRPTPAISAQGPFVLLHSLFDPSTNAQVGTQQGHSVAVDGNIAVVGAPYDDVGAKDSGVVNVYNVTTGALINTLTNPSPAQLDNFGFAVAISGTRVVVGVRYYKAPSGSIGNAYVYDLASAAPGLPIIALTNPSPNTLIEFGSAVAIDGALVVIGGVASRSDFQGSASVYNLDSLTPTLPVVTLKDPGLAGHSGFGRGVAISGTRIVAGAFLNDTGEIDAGCAYVFELSSITPMVPILTLTNPSPASSDYFGWPLAISGTRVVIGAPEDDTGTNSSGSAYVYDLTSATPAVPVSTLTNPSPDRNDYFGLGVAISGASVVIGAYQDDTDATNAGSVYVFDMNSTTPTVAIAKLANPRPARGAYFGFSVAISGAQVVVGSADSDGLKSAADYAYVYDLASAAPAVPLATLHNQSPGANTRFGSSAGISGPRVVVGATSPGSVNVYDFSSAVPTVPVATLTNPNSAESGGFGSSAAISGTRLVVGAPEENAYAGSTYVYDLSNISPAATVLTLTKPNPAPGDRFGGSAAISGALVVVGAYLDDTGAINAGAAYVYDLASVAPTVPVMTLTNPSPAVDGFGYSVAISSTRVVVGAIWDDTGTNDAGSAYVYDLASASPTVPVAKLTNPSPASSDYFGWSVAISGTRVAVGAPQDDTGAADSGSTYVYDLDSATPAVPVATLNNPSPASADRFGWMVAISGGYVVVGVPLDQTGVIGAGSAYVYDLAGTAPTVPVATLNNPRPGYNNNFGFSVAIDGATIVVGTPRDDTGAADRGAAYIFGSRPELSILPAASGLATLSWMPTTSSGFVLQYADGLAPTNWLNAPSGEANPVTVSSTNATRFYRLFQP